MNLDILKSPTSRTPCDFDHAIFSCSRTICHHSEVDSEEPSSVQYHKRGFILIHSHAKHLKKKHKWLWFVLACSLAMKKQERVWFRSVITVSVYFWGQCQMIHHRLGNSQTTEKSRSLEPKISPECCNNCFHISCSWAVKKQFIHLISNTKTKTLGRSSSITTRYIFYS